MAARNNVLNRESEGQSMKKLLQHDYRHISVRPIAGALGAEISGVDISRPLDGEVVAEIRAAFLDHLVIFFRDQKLTPQAQLAFSKQFGEPMEYPQLRGLPECPLVTPVVKLAHEVNNFGGVWHSDTTYLERPPMASMLYAIETPPYGGVSIRYLTVSGKHWTHWSASILRPKRSPPRPAKIVCAKPASS
jgi:alpha-ketoglutarate-dependent taurine dioxygenase